MKSSFVGEDLLRGSDIDVDTVDHVVTLKGTVTTEAGRMRVVKAAREIEGVRNVIDRLTSTTPSCLCGARGSVT